MHAQISKVIFFKFNIEMDTEYQLMLTGHLDHSNVRLRVALRHRDHCRSLLSSEISRDEIV